MNKTVLLIGNVGAKSAIKLKEEANSSGYIFDTVSTKAVFIDEQDLVSQWVVEGKEIWSYDVYFFRAVSKDLPRLIPFINELTKRGKRVVENCLAVDGKFPEDKFVKPSLSNSYKVPESIVLESKDIRSILQQITFPVVVKKLGQGSSLGKGVRLIESEKELLTLCELFTGLIQVQKYFPISFDTRVFVIGDSCICGYDRYKVNDNFLTTAKGGERKISKLTDKQCEAALEAAKLQGLEIAGVDMFESGGDIYIIEVNSSPRFRILEKVTGVNVAKEMLVYLTKP